MSQVYAGLHAMLAPARMPWANTTVATSRYEIPSGPI